MIKRRANWYGLDMLQLYLQMSREQLSQALEQLQSLEGCQDKPYLLDNEIITRIIAAHSEQNENAWVFVEQCSKWRKQMVSRRQLEDLAEIENNVLQMKKCNNQILALAKQFRGQTIEELMAKDDVELAVDFLDKLFK